MVFLSLHSNWNDNSQGLTGLTGWSLRTPEGPELQESRTLAVTILEMHEFSGSCLAIPGPPTPGTTELPSDPAMQNGSTFLFSFVLLFQSRSNVFPT